MSERLLAEWGARVRAEYASAAITAQALHWCIQCGLPEDVVDTALRIVRDELDHARLCHACGVALGGADIPLPLEQEALGAAVSTETPLASLVDSIVRNFCLGESFAVPLFAAMRRDAAHGAVQPVLDRVLQDETVHRAFGWDTLDALLDIDPDGVRARIQGKLPAYLSDFHQGYGQAAPGPPLTQAERSAGMIDAWEYRSIYERTLREVIGPRFARRGITLPEVP